MTTHGDGAVLVTGCSSGIGEATARRLAGAGWIVYATARRPESIAGLEQAGCRTLALDVTDESSMRAAIDAVEDEHGALCGLVNNAGYSQSGAVESVPVDLVRKQFETNVFGLLRLTQMALPKMRERGKGRIVNIGSMGGKLTFPGGGIYHASKYALEAISDALRFELAGFGIQVVLIEPGLIRTSFDEAALASMDELEAADAYGEFNAAAARLTAEAYSNRAAAVIGGGPDAVAKTIEKALSTGRPRARYTVTPSAKILLTQRKIVSDRVWDLMMRTQYPRPGN